MGTSAYTDEEIKLVFQTLFNEKKKLKELEIELKKAREEFSALKNQGSTPGLQDDHLIEENKSLNVQLLSLMKKYEKAIHTPKAPSEDLKPSSNETAQGMIIKSLENEKSLLEENNQALIKQLEDVKKLLLKSREEKLLAEKKVHQLEKLENSLLKSEQEKKLAESQIQRLENEIETLKEKPQEIARSNNASEAALGRENSHLAAESLKAQNQTLQNELSNASEQALRQKSRLEKLAQVIQEKDKRIHDLHQYEFTHKKLSEQRQDLQASLEKATKQNLLLEANLNESRQHSQQLERVIKFLRERSEEGQLASAQFREDFETSQGLIQKHEKELKLIHEQLSEAKTHALFLEEEKKSLEEELKALHPQFAQLKTAYDGILSKNNSLKASNEESKELFEHEKENSLKLIERINQQDALLDAAKKEIDGIKQSLVRGMREVNDLNARFKESVQEKVAALNKLHHARLMHEKQEAEIVRVNALILKTKEEYSATIDVLQSQIGSERKEYDAQICRLLEKGQHLQNDLESAQKEAQEKYPLLAKNEELQKDLNKALERLDELLAANQIFNRDLSKIVGENEQARAQLHALELKLSGAVKDKLQTQEALTLLKGEFEEKESQIRTAQQHLAKKVKETTVLSEEIESYKQQLHDIKQQHIQHQIRIAELQASLDIHNQQEKRLQEQLSEAVKNADSQVKKWEQKYFEMHDKWQTAELRKKELEKLEEKQAQMQALLANFGTVLGAPITPSRYEAPITSYEAPREKPLPEAAPSQSKPEPAPVVEITELQFQKEPPKPYQNLFSMPKPPEKPRQNLFD